MKPDDTKCANLLDELKRITQKMHDPDVIARNDADEAFLEETIFHGLKDLRPWLDSPSIKHFSAGDFRIVIDRCTLHNDRLTGIEIFTSKREMLGVRIVQEGEDPNLWCINLLERYKGRKNLYCCATYDASGRTESR